MNILYINHYAGSIQHGMEYRPYYLAREWVNLGHRVTIVASSYSHLRQKNIVLCSGHSYATEIIDGVNYIWCKTPKYLENGLKRVINILVFLHRLRAIRHKLINELRPDLVIASSTYPFDTKIAYQIARTAKAKFIYEVHDLWPLTPIEVGGMSRWHPFLLAMQLAENFGYQHADKVVSLLPKARDYMLEHGLQAAKFVHIPNGVVIGDWLNANQKMPDEHRRVLNKLKYQEHKFIIAYAGGMGESNALDYLLSAAKLIEDQPVALVLVGDGVLKMHFAQRISAEQLHNVHLMPAINKLQIPDFLAACDALYIGWNNLPIYRFGICPNKLFDYMLAKKPVIHSVSAGNDLVREANCGISVAAADCFAIAQALVSISKMKVADLANLAQNGYDFVLRYHDYRVLATQFLADLAT